VVCASGNGCQFSRMGVGNWLQPGFASLAAKGGIWHGRVAVLAFVLVIAFLSSHGEATTSLGLAISGYRSGRCTGPLGLDETVSGTSTDSEFTARPRSRSRSKSWPAARRTCSPSPSAWSSRCSTPCLPTTSPSIVGLKGRQGGRWAAVDRSDRPCRTALAGPPQPGTSYPRA
jgi:hypothetical protein